MRSEFDSPRLHHELMKIIFTLISIFCFVHIYRDYLQIKNGYKTWFTGFAHILHAPKYEKHGMVVFFLLGILFLYLTIHAA
ncbi:MAG TPA: hypothetical protein VFB03_02685 [Candidatus Saccharimonadales bacterium]|nr:hypothetical protein [Candidatus Saccharimonadales bacterium]